MGILKGNRALSRYRLAEALTPEFTEEFIGERLQKFAFVDIERSSEESSTGWVELLNDLGADFAIGSYKFGPNYAFHLRVDARRLSPKILSRYFHIAEADFYEKMGRKPNKTVRLEMREKLRLDLLKRTLLSTDLYEVIWLVQQNEIWLGAAGEKIRAVFEESWLQTFGLSIRLLVPITLGLELTAPERRLALMDLKPSLLGSED
ncbi:MAG: recombination-associated protein RdgC [Deltaproteobacteria bacterium]|jgi:hypothetical protein|nr:recombination-associated protein RdgC [Deltaproteobacteria bacterium]